jgi:hypothetical protein
MTARAVKLAGFSLSEVGIAATSEKSRTSSGQNSSQQTSVTLPNFLQHPERATIHILQTKTGMQTVAIRDLYAQ